ncbi:hypothetical protein AMTR_s00068p00156710 [Amborella trichopoda]|uniref:Hexosyltransferase n=2 Tax=Amborella trichopoda TaxID=13333 RepID=U5DIR1_AMBTC|nr:hypothetical protein AMTR_s00068p00156710 [Amborella trichopoda]
MKNVKGSSRRFSYRSLFPTVCVLAVLLPFVFMRTAFLALEGANKCSSIHCLGRRFLIGEDSALTLRDEFRRVLTQVEGQTINERLVNAESFDQLVEEVIANRHDVQTFVLKVKTLLLKLDRKARREKLQGQIYRHFASIGIPRSIHCLCLRLAEEYSTNALARRPLPPPAMAPRLTDNSLYHFVIISDNVMATYVVISSTVKNFLFPKHTVFHVITDKKTCAPMHAWFALNPVYPAVIEIKGLHQFDWPLGADPQLLEILDIARHSYGRGGHDRDLVYSYDAGSHLGASPLDHIKIFLPELFPKLRKVVFLDEDVVVQRDLSRLWTIDLHDKVVGAIEMCGDEHHQVRPRKLGDYLNFSNTVVYEKFNSERYAWVIGVNVFDLEAWRDTNITRTYHYWLKLNLETGLKLWRLGTLPPVLLAFEGHVHVMDPQWHVMGLGYQSNIDQKIVDNAAVIHFNGPAKPWLEIGFPEYRSLWTRYVNYSNEFIQSCIIA